MRLVLVMERIFKKRTCNLAVNPCATVKCGFFGECDVINGSVTCVCPGSGSRPSCGNEKEPVCGSDGEIYDSFCHLMAASCQQEVMILPALPEMCGKKLYSKFVD